MFYDEVFLMFLGLEDSQDDTVWFRALNVFVWWNKLKVHLLSFCCYVDLKNISLAFFKYWSPRDRSVLSLKKAVIYSQKLWEEQY